MTNTKNMAASVAARLRARARATARPYDELLIYYAIERFLFRLATTQHRERFVLKGGLMLQMWGATLVRATRDIDLHGHGQPTLDEITTVIAECIAADVDDDGLVFDPSTIRATEIREQERYGGVRATFLGYLERARINMQVDIGFGDAITPGVVQITYPTLLDLPSPKLDAYPVETTIAEKLEAIVDLGLSNSRMKDFFDLWSISRQLELDGTTVVAAVRATFSRRGTDVPSTTPTGLTSQFSSDPSKLAQWSGFIGRLTLTDPPTLDVVVARIEEYATPMFDETATTLRWIPSHGWTRGV